MHCTGMGAPPGPIPSPTPPMSRRDSERVQPSPASIPVKALPKPELAVGGPGPTKAPGRNLKQASAVVTNTSDSIARPAWAAGRAGSNCACLPRGQASAVVADTADSLAAAPGKARGTDMSAPGSQSSPTRQAALITAWPEFFPLTISLTPPATPRPSDLSQPSPSHDWSESLMPHSHSGSHKSPSSLGICSCSLRGNIQAVNT